MDPAPPWTDYDREDYPEPGQWYDEWEPFWDSQPIAPRVQARPGPWCSGRWQCNGVFGHAWSGKTLEASAGLVHAVVLPQSQTEGFKFLVATSPVHTDAWRVSATKLDAGAGPVPLPQLLLHGSAGWLVVVNRTVVGGARLQNGQWLAWKPPCAGAGTPAELAASTASDLVAFCADGIWNDRPQGERVFVSINGGSSFRQVSSAVPVPDVQIVAAAAPGVWLVGSADSPPQGPPQAVLFRTADGGRSWKTVHRAGEANWLDLGFTSAQQGVVIHEANVDRLLMTLDDGQTWSPVATRWAWVSQIWRCGYQEGDRRALRAIQHPRRRRTVPGSPHGPRSARVGPAPCPAPSPASPGWPRPPAATAPPCSSRPPEAPPEAYAAAKAVCAELHDVEVGDAKTRSLRQTGSQEITADSYSYCRRTKFF